jgi:hypothetical protein
VTALVLLLACVLALALAAIVVLRRENAELRESLTATVNALGESNHDLWRLRGKLAEHEAHARICGRLATWQGKPADGGGR